MLDPQRLRALRAFALRGTIVAAAEYLKGHGDTLWTPPAEYLAPHVSDTIVRILLSNPKWAAARM